MPSRTAPKKYVLLCAPSGSALSKAVKKLENEIEGNTEHRDIETILCGLPETTEALGKVGNSRPEELDEATKWPTMYDVTWCLSRSQVKKLWKQAIQRATHELRNAPREHFKILSCNLIYFGGERNEFYSPLSNKLFTKDNLVPSHVLLFIDDVYDMYLRLSKKKSLYTPGDRVPGYLGRIKEDEDIEVTTLSDKTLAVLCMEWQVDIFTRLLHWRYLEMISAENLAAQLNLDSQFLVWGTKQLTKAAALWLKKSNPIVYLSHPISRPRKMPKQNGQWPPVVKQFNNLQLLFSRENITCIMPTAIDELRIKRSKSQGSDFALREPILGERWPLPGSKNGVVYSKPEAVEGMHPRGILALESWDFINEWVCTFLPIRKVGFRKT